MCIMDKRKDCRLIKIKSFNLWFNELNKLTSVVSLHLDLTMGKRTVEKLYMKESEIGAK